MLDLYRAGEIVFKARLQFSIRRDTRIVYSRKFPFELDP